MADKKPVAKKEKQKKPHPQFLMRCQDQDGLEICVQGPDAMQELERFVDMVKSVWGKE